MVSFQERFKGKMEKIGKEGIQSMNNSLPIQKPSVNQVEIQKQKELSEQLETLSGQSYDKQINELSFENYNQQIDNDNEIWNKQELTFEQYQKKDEYNQNMSFKHYQQQQQNSSTNSSLNSIKSVKSKIQTKNTNKKPQSFRQFMIEKEKQQKNSSENTSVASSRQQSEASSQSQKIKQKQQYLQLKNQDLNLIQEESEEEIYQFEDITLQTDAEYKRMLQKLNKT